MQTLLVTDWRAGWQPPLVIEIISSDGERVYPVRRLSEGVWECPCPGFTYRQECRHVRKARILAGEIITVDVLEELL